MKKLKAQLVEILKTAAIPKSIEAEAELILVHVSKLKSSALAMLDPETSAKLSTQVESESKKIAQERVTGKPLQHILGYQFFYEHEYLVSSDVLIPRPETEILIQAAIKQIEEKYGKNSTFRFAELGLGSGILSSELLAHFPNSTGVATEISLPAQKIAQKNLKSVVGENWNSRLQIITPDPSQAFEALLTNAPYDLIISNPPYVSREDEIEAEVLKHEPGLALFPLAEKSENYFYENFILHSEKLLNPGGIAFFEIPHERSMTLGKMFMDANFSKAKIIPDLTRRPRVIMAIRS